MDFSWSESERQRKADAAAFAASLDVDAVAHDQAGTFPRAAWQACADYGLQGLALPEAYAGTPAVDIMAAMLAMEGFGYGCPDNGLAFALNAQMWTVQLPILQFGTDAQKDRYLPPLADGRWIGCHALTEPNIGSDIYHLEMRALSVEGGYRLTGSKRYVSLAPIADVVLVFATLDPALGRWGLTAFLVDRDTEGVRFSATEPKMGLRSVPIGQIHFEDAFIPHTQRLGPEGAGFAISNASLEYERCCILGSQLGAMERQLETAVAYAKGREQFGQPIGKFQAVSHRIADMKLRLETARLLLYQVAWCKQQGQSAMMEAALLKLHLSESFLASSLDAVRVHGGHGYMTEGGIERDLRDAVGGVLYAGTSDIQRNIIARLLGL